jgi:hypothetical protein
MQQPETIEMEPASHPNYVVLKRRFGMDAEPDLRYRQALTENKEP